MLHTLEPTGWNAAREEQLKVLWAEGQSAAAIADALGGGLTRNAVIGKVRRLKLPPRYAVTPKTHAKPKANGTGRPKAAAIRHRVEMQQAPTVREPVDPFTGDEGVDCTHLIGLFELTSQTCRYPSGDPLKEGFGFCGKQVQQDSVYCPEHHQRCYRVLA